MVRVRWSPSPAISTEALDSHILRPLASFWPVSSSLDESEEYYSVKTSELEVRITKSGRLRVDFYDLRRKILLSTDESIEYDGFYLPSLDPTYEISRAGNMPPPVGFAVKNTRSAPMGECYLGLGDWGGPLDRRTAIIQHWNEDAWAWSELRNPKYTSMPIFHALDSQHGGHIYSIFLNNPSRTMFDMCSSDPVKLSFQVSVGALDYFFVGSSDGRLSGPMKELGSLTGMPAFLPKWGYGYHMSKFTYTQSELTEMVSRHREASIPLSAVFVDLDYMDQLPSTTDNEWQLVQFKWGPAYPSPAPMIESLLEEGISTVVIVEPFVTDEDPKFFHAEERGFFVRDERGRPCYTDLWCAERAGWIDYTKPSAAAWWIGELSEFMSNYRVSGVWNDLNETADKGKIPLTAVYSMGEADRSSKISPDRRHSSVKNIYAIYNTKASYAASEKADPSSRPFVLSRGAFPGIQKWAAGWSGDNLSSEDHLRCNIRVGTSMGISGMSNFGHDIGGFSGVPSAEVMERWQEWAVYTPLMRNHYSKQSKPREFYRFPPETASRLASTILQRYYLLPTIYSLAWSASQTGWPIAAPVPAVFPEDKKTYTSNENDIMLGESILAAPVVKVGDRSRRVYLPATPGGWFSFWEEEAWSPGDQIVQAQMGRAPAFARAGAIIPVAAKMTSAARPWGRGAVKWDNQMEIHVWPGAFGRFTIYDDDGKTPLHSGDRYRIEVGVVTQNAGNRWIISLDSRQPMRNRDWKVVLRGLKSPPSRIRVNGAEVEVSEKLPPSIDIPKGKFPLGVIVEIDSPDIVPPR